MVQVISNLGSSTSSFSAATVVRPVFVSFGFAVFVVIAARYVVMPLTIRLNAKESQDREAYLNRSLTHQYGGLVVHTTILVGLMTAASYAGTSNLFAAYLAGASISWWDSDVPHLPVQAFDARSKRRQERIRELARSEGGDTAIGGDAHRLPTTDAAEKTAGSTEQGCGTFLNATVATSGRAVFDEFYSQPLQRILKPFLFASIGVSVPISKIFRSAIVWRGLIFTILMCIGKLVCGLWLIRIPGLPQKLPNIIRARKEEYVKGSAHKEQETSDRAKNGDGSKDNDPVRAAGGLATPPQEPELTSAPEPKTSTVAKVKKPLSLYPAAIIGLAMVARGEIGFLICALSESNGFFAPIV